MRAGKKQNIKNGGGGDGGWTNERPNTDHVT